MISIKIFLALSFVGFCIKTDLSAQPIPATNQQPMQTDGHLTEKQQAIVTISAFTAQGDMPQLQKALNAGLDAGLSINEVKEILVQLYAYAGFPRSLNALQRLMDFLNERKQKGITDVAGNEPSPLPTDTSKLLLGTQTQTKLIGMPVKGDLYEFAPTIDQFLKEHLFADIFGRDNLDWKTREIATISALAALGGVESQLRAHFGIGLHNGLTDGELTHLVAIIQSRVCATEGKAASEVLQTVVKQRSQNTATDKKPE